MLERGTSGWWVSVDMGHPGPALVPHLELHDGESFRISTLENGLRVVLVPLGASEGTPVMVVLTDWGLDDEQLAPLLSTVSRLGRVALDNARLVRVAGERQRLRIELELAGRTQEQLMPTEAPRWPGLEVVGHSRPSADCGGDYFDWFDLPGRGFVTCVADVSGHGVGAAIVMATLRGYLNASLRHNEPLDETLSSITTMLCSILEPWQFVTVFLAEIDVDGKTLRFCNAGHEAALLIRSKGSVERLEADAPPLGIDPLLTPRVETVVLQPDDMLVIPTDGLAEAEDPQGVQIGRDQFEEWVVRCVRESHSAVAARDRILAEVANYRDHSEQMDDETLLVLRRRGETR
jgi:sigma-B regulation protein RsbU (phosphoserine phosphatase)